MAENGLVWLSPTAFLSFFGSTVALFTSCLRPCIAIYLKAELEINSIIALVCFTDPRFFTEIFSLKSLLRREWLWVSAQAGYFMCG
ncbi:uncharacterized protein BP01DRAFT_187940 [Aspergillus saccharolyticus JOP 1030-1]|uniref:Uncharacterized protein n=1 Tax=Aspergillus saccharolyticus JOP 1030-1 TaxID=1450539 RepID=A0A319A0D2_9EURO|nr:hypothetical protein BP01DRAFT_187940 [Aspergillus saccharolyticus JOP 1030-1]PYH41072.1 hypothetical protein BP01DRAFT_187940 [Aspergillus saccharolyticus JOP 1030-1]